MSMPTTPTLPRLIITPSTPLPPSQHYFDLPSPLPSPTSQKPHIDYDTIKTRRQSQSFEHDEHEYEHSHSEKASRPIPTRSYSLPTESYLSPPPTAHPRSGKRPLRMASPLISILFLLFAFLLVLSTAMCTSSSAGRLLDLQREAGRKIHDLLRMKGYGCGGHENEVSPSDLNAEVLAEVGRGGSLLDLFWGGEEEYEHYAHSLVVAGPAISLDGSAIWDFDSQF
ncbi:hypothetical protein I302_108271 [Kwoniella bestiolae CBS 10118]|uniref:Uncharacterized protein n=1 Tax=Kwoniella bestiolae CBS 10118 TaxID=1296100 RepID=A0A1B9FW57_9TREE|nr:hypothetical protein I302_07362 [Kwoniella bestiolae CBS 10118]OCF23012.1 hypothetical protein I302_07362 [Kwoniella bestiolae CBS 10118]